MSSLFLPPDDRLADLLGIASEWTAVAPYLAIAGYLIWYMVGAFFLITQLVLPRIGAVWIGAAGFAVGVGVCLAEVYELPQPSFAEQLATFLVLNLLMLAVHLLIGGRRRNATASDQAPPAPTDITKE